LQGEFTCCLHNAGFGVPFDICVQGYITGIKSLNSHLQYVEEIHLVDLSDDIVQKMKETFADVRLG